MKIFRYLLTVLTFFLVAVCCGGDGPDPKAEAPATPDGLTLHSRTRTSLTFQWNPVENVTGYDYTLTEGSAEVKGGSVRTRNVSIDGLSAGTEYRFAVRAVNAAGTSSWSAWLEASTEAEPDPGPGPGPGPEPSDKYYEQFSIPAAEEDGVARAFPGAEGGGMYVTGGRGGRVIHVTNLNDKGEGSLRAALTASGARTVVFDVAGIIELQSAIQIKNGDLTVAGQTAPGDGICIKNYSVNIAASNVIVRFLHFRLGDEGPNAGDSEDCIWGRYQSDIIIDHCSMSWSIDECASVSANEHFTLQWCILPESMNDSAHSKGSHGYGGIWGGKDASFHHNLLANHHSRNPRIDHPEIYPKSNGEFDLSKRGSVDLRNLVVYNWGDNSSYGGEGGKFNFVGCWYKPGPDSKDRHYFVDAYRLYTRSDKTTVDYGYPDLFMSGNFHSGYSDISSDNSAGIYWHNGGSEALRSEPNPLSGPSGKAVYTTTHPASAGMETVLSQAGDRIHRDAVDVRAVEGVKNNTGRIINTPSDAGGWPEYKATAEDLARTADTDADGMPDWFEEQFGLNKTEASDARSITLDRNGRYTNLEMYLHYLVKDIIAAQNQGGSYTKL